AQGVQDSTGAQRADAELIARTVLAYLNLAVFEQLVTPERVDRVFADLRTAILLVIGARLNEWLASQARTPTGAPAGETS
ncbi:MAG TPA: hypothetical protein VIN04_11660, partial [Myxococcota bacterium]